MIAQYTIGLGSACVGWGGGGGLGYERVKGDILTLFPE